MATTEKPKQQPSVEDSNTPSHSTVAPKPNEAPHNGGLQTAERRIDPGREALQHAAMLDHQRRIEPGQWIQLPNGEAVKMSGFVGMKYPGETAAEMLSRPQDMLLNPMPRYSSGPRYTWKVRTSADARDGRPAETANLHRGGRIRYVETNEIDPNSPIAVYTEYATANNVYVTWQTLILCEILDETLSYQQSKAWEDLSVSRVMNLESEVLAHPDTRISNKTTAEVKIEATRRGG